MDQAVAGDEVVLTNGTYQQQLTTVRSGTLNTPIIIRAETRRLATVKWPLSGTYSRDPSRRTVRILHSHITVRGLVLNGSQLAHDLVHIQATGSDANDITGIIVEDNALQDSGAGGILIFGVPPNGSCIIRHNLIERIGFQELGESIYLGSASGADSVTAPFDVQVYGNVIRGEGISRGIDIKGSTRPHVHHNIVENVSGDCFIVASRSGNVHDNIVRNSANCRSAIDYIGEDVGNDIHNNVFYNLTGASAARYKTPPSSTPENTVHDNTFCALGSYTTCDRSSSPCGPPYPAGISFTNNPGIPGGRPQGECDTEALRITREMGNLPGATEPGPSTATSFAVNAGGPGFTASDSTVYLADQTFSGGTVSAGTTDAIAGTTDDSLFQTARFGNFSYAIPLTNGTYDITLYFAEFFFTANGQRQFDVTAEGTAAVTNLDIHATVGHDTAHSVTFQRTITDGVLNLSFTPDINNAIVSAIKVVNVSVPAPPASLTFDHANTVDQTTLDVVFTGPGSLSGCTAGSFSIKLNGGAAQAATVVTPTAATARITVPFMSYSDSITVSGIAGACTGTIAFTDQAVTNTLPPPPVPPVAFASAVTVTTTTVDVFFTGLPGQTLSGCTAGKFYVTINDGALGAATGLVVTGMSVRLTVPTMAAGQTLKLYADDRACTGGPVPALTDKPITNSLGGSMPVLTQSAFRFYVADQREGAALCQLSTNQNASWKLLSKGRIRFQVTGATANTTLVQREVECSDDSGAYYVVGAGSGRISYGEDTYASANLANMPTTSQIGGCTFQATGKFVSAGMVPPIDGVNIDSGKCVEIEVTLKLSSGAAAQFSDCRIKGLDTYTQTPRITLIN